MNANPNHQLRQARKNRGWSQQFVADQINTASFHISQWECGIISLNTLFRERLFALFEMEEKELGLLQDEINERHIHESLKENLISTVSMAAQHDPPTSPILSDVSTSVSRSSKSIASMPSSIINWLYEEPSYEVESSLPSSSLVISEAPTQPDLNPSTRMTYSSAYLDRIAEVWIDKVPTGKLNINDTGNKSSVSSWTSGDAASSSYAQLMATRTRRKHRSHFSFNSIDRVRCWLVRPGRLEFVLWLGETILMISVTGALLLVTAFSFDWMAPRSAGTSSSSISGTATQVPQATTVTTTLGLTLTLLPGQLMHLYGQGFSPHGLVVFTIDGAATSRSEHSIR
jgi:transcriptional regulator with XRE-family HTH domain